MLPIPPKPSLWKKVTNVMLKVAAQLDMQSQKIINVLDPTADQDAATKKYTDDTFITIATISRGTATITAGNQTVVVNHGLSGTPYVTCEGQSEYGTGKYINTKTATQFTINIDAPQPVNVDFDWIAML